MHKQRLLKLADLLEADAENEKGIKFDLSDWVDTAEGRRPGIDCGTAACAVGLACLSPDFQAEGLSLDCTMPTYEGLYGWTAVARFFEVDHGEADHLFSSYRYKPEESKGAIGERAVAQRIRAFVAGTAAP